MGIQDVIRWFLPREHHFYDFLERQSKLAREAAVELSGFAAGKSELEAAYLKVEEQERLGDRAVEEMEDALARTFVTPIDREDLHHLSSQLDDVLDQIYSTIRSCDLLGVSPLSEPMKKMVAELLGCAELLDDAVPRLRKHEYSAIVDATRKIRQRERDADRVYGEGVSALFADGEERSPRVLIREKTVLDGLERAVDFCDNAANTLTNLAVKHG